MTSWGKRAGEEDKNDRRIGPTRSEGKCINLETAENTRLRIERYLIDYKATYE